MEQLRNEAALRALQQKPIIEFLMDKMLFVPCEERPLFIPRPHLQNLCRELESIMFEQHLELIGLVWSTY